MLGSIGRFMMKDPISVRIKRKMQNDHWHQPLITIYRIYIVQKKQM